MKLSFNFVIMYYLNLEKVAARRRIRREEGAMYYCILNFLSGTILREKA